MRIGSLFSGVGGLDLGLEWSGLGHTVWQVEADPHCRKVLERHWPHVERFRDVRTITAAQLAPVDLICGGFPCQDVSAAGKGAGLAGERSGLWAEFARVVGEIGPRWVIVENVDGGKPWVDEVCSALAGIGYDTLPIPLSAEDVGAPHRRRRIFVVAYAHGQRQQTRTVATATPAAPRPKSVGSPSGYAADARSGKRAPGIQESATQRQLGADPTGRHSERVDPSSWAALPDLRVLDDGSASRVDRLRSLGNAVVPQCAEVIGWVVRELDAATR